MDSKFLGRNDLRLARQLELFPHSVDLDRRNAGCTADPMQPVADAIERALERFYEMRIVHGARPRAGLWVIDGAASPREQTARRSLEQSGLRIVDGGKKALW